MEISAQRIERRSTKHFDFQSDLPARPSRPPIMPALERLATWPGAKTFD